MVPETELDASINDQSMGLLARLMSRGLRVLQSHLIGSKTTVIFINQVRDQIKQSTYFPSTTTSGGRALKYAASIRVEVRRQEAIKQGEKVIGFITKVIIVKNKFNGPMVQVPLRLYFETGFIIGDLIKRYHKLIGIESYLLTGTDEHGEKILNNSKKEGLRPEEFVSLNSSKFQKLHSQLEISADFFVRTTDENHKEYVKEFFIDLIDKNLVYKST
ncbi:hypothetical protein PVNG_02394 [Plasmodium vivax North Korean]|uniref:RecA family profile 2 domain-containing protein n=1 Tax=Plasmodium vivax North Korean TaxID=1035514 RepID=A0A0J9TM60_PLAVI|nr:hypothetical protein PVNG_02394 [Plasmodium vivax North Korean]